MNKIDIERTAQIAFLKLNSEEKQEIEKSIEAEVKWLSKVGDLSGIAPTTKITTIIASRKDEVIPSSKREDLLKNAKDNSNGAFTVPKIVE
ncbi:MAG: Asp-tRNA(Asn)/Glu-tRNA(Gln) amidotransferase subunit GatC [Clostridia bacterium]|nr:Asp-tRNA(Asn)/Glu-tRNA(Gln) amidotransferase subunit GatC [Clostridia bacterium]